MVDQITRDSLQIARLEEQFNEIRRDVESLNEQIGGLQSQLAEVLRTLNEARGGWKTLMQLGGAAAVLGGLFSWLANHIAFK